MESIFSLYNNVLSSTNKLANEALTHGGSLLKSNPTPTSSPEESSFGDIMQNKIEELNDKQIQADHMIQDFISGDADDLHSVMIATEEARLSLELAVQVRNKCIEAYKEINNMQL
ncbi:MAG: flagellar hook-basal body complex protein FliE [Eubacteriales bacterium]